MVPLFGAGSKKTVLNPPVNRKIQELFNAFECFSSTYQGKLNFQGLFKTVLYIQVLFKATIIFKDFSRKTSKFKYFSSLGEPGDVT